MGIHDIWLFAVAGLLLIVTPGPDMALIVARSAQQGVRAGVVAALGVGAGLFIHIAAAAMGISALILASATAFTILKWLGAFYLIYLGIQMLRASFREQHQVSQRLLTVASLRQIFIQGFLSNVLNPKVAIFFLAFLPQFVDAGAPSKVAAFVTLGLLFNAMGTAWNLAVALFAGLIAASNGYRRLKVWLERTIGMLLVGVGVKLALADRP